MKATFAAEGLVLVRNTGLEGDMGAMSRLARGVMGGSMDYEAGTNPRQHIAKNVYDVGAPDATQMHFHHEMVYAADSVTNLGFCVAEAVPDGSGATFLSANAGATQEILATGLGRKLADLGITYIRCLPSKTDPSVDPARVFNYWQSALGTEDAEEAKAIAEAKGLVVDFGPGHFMRTAYTTAAFEFHAASDRNLLYSSVAEGGLLFDNWPGMSHLPHIPRDLRKATPAHRPTAITFGDGSPFSEEECRTFVQVHSLTALSFP